MHKMLGFILTVITLLNISVNVQAEEIIVEATKEDCQRIEKHVARNDVNYKPGVDVRGRPVKPADLNSTPLIDLDEIVIDLSLPIKELFSEGKPIRDDLATAEVKVGTIRYNMKSGKFFFNDRELADPALNAIAVECNKRYSK